MRVLVSGASGLVGKELVKSFDAKGYDVYKLVRKTPSNDKEIQWDPEEGKIQVDKLEGFDAMVHLSGDNLSSGRWTEDKKRKIRDSRIASTFLLTTAMQELEKKPEVFISASAIGFYGSRGDEIMTESSEPGDNFLSWVCRDWEKAVDPATVAGVRAVNLRIGMVLSGSGGALKKMLPGFIAGMAGNLGSGNQYMSWISIQDLVNVIHFAIDNKEVKGPINCVAPEPVRNKQFTKTLAKVLSRPAVIHAPAFGLRLAFGEMADAIMLSSTRVIPERLTQLGFQFEHPTLESAFRHILRKRLK